MKSVLYRLKNYPLLLGCAYLFLVYFIVGKLSFFLSSHADFIKVVWPPAGIALVALARWDRRLWPGVLFGSFLLHGTGFVGEVAGSTKALVLAFSLAMGDTFQAFFGAHLIQKCWKNLKEAMPFHHLSQCILLGGPLACLLSATWGLTSLAIGGVWPWQSFIFSWLAWWAADCIGVILFFPLIYLFSMKHFMAWGRWPWAIGTLLGLGFSLVVLSFNYTYTWEAERFEAGLEKRVKGLKNNLQNYLDHTLDTLLAIKSFYASTEKVTRENFRNFTKFSLQKFYGIQALEWVPKVSQTKKSVFEKIARQEGYSEFQFTEKNEADQLIPVQDREIYYPVYFIEPQLSNEPAFGFDLGSHPARLTALIKAQDLGSLIATKPVTLVQEQAQQRGFLVFQPIYQNGILIENLEQRRRHLQGFALGVFRVGDLIQAALHGVDQEGLSLEIFDVDAGADGFLFRSEEGRVTISHKEEKVSPLSSLVPWVNPYTIKVADRNWILRVSILPFYTKVFQKWQSLFVLLVGLVFMGLLTILLFFIAGHASRVEYLVDKRTNELQQTNQVLKKEIAQRRKLQRELKEKTKDLERSNQDLEQFAYVVSHDLQEPLRMITSYLELFQEMAPKRLSKEAKKYLSYVVDGAMRMKHLIDDLLSFSRTDVRSKALKIIPVGEAIEKALSNLELKIRDKRAKIDFEDMPQVLADDVQVIRLFQNLVDNGLKYSQGKKPEIKIRSKRTNGKWTFSVQDNGIGMDPEASKNIFKLFQRLHKTDEYEGTGIGLAVCKKIVERHGGKIWVDSKPEKGSTFYFTFPAKLRKKK